MEYHKRMQKSSGCIGVFTASLDDEYQSTVWRAIEDEAQKRNFASISFLGSRIGSPISAEASSNLAYHLANEQTIDGLIIISSSLATFFTSLDLKEFFSPWESLPKVSIGMDIPGMSSVTVESSKAIEQIIEHLVHDHGRKNFALIGGPPTHDEAVSRKKALIDALNLYDLELDPELMVDGTFVQDSGARGMEALLAKNKVIDTVFCLNDRMAQGALSLLSQRGYHVPEDISVIGFDGIPASRYTHPPLTTVVQPMTNLGREAVAMLDRLMGSSQEEHKVLRSTAIIRESCGCAPQFNFNSEGVEIPSYASRSEKKSIQELVTLVKQESHPHLIALLNKGIDTTISENGMVERWHEYISIVESRCLDCPTKSKKNLIGAARAFVGEKIGRYQAAKRLDVQSSFEALRHVSAMLAGTFEMSELVHNLKNSLHLFGIKRGYLVVFSHNTGKGRLVMDMESGDIPSFHEIREFDSDQLLPPHYDRVWRKGQWILLPLVYNTEPLGYIIVPVGMESPALYDVLQEQISSNLKGTLLLEEIKSHEQTLSEQVAIRTKDLIKANKELSNEIKRRTELEKEVMEISSKTMERIGQDLHDDLAQHLLGISLLTSSIRKSTEAQESELGSSLAQISHLLTESIMKIKTISRGLLPLEMEAHTLSKRVDALVNDTKRYFDVDIDIVITPSFEEIEEDRTLHVFRIIQEALTNAVKHSKADKVVISLYSETDEHNERVHYASVTDNGVGIPRRIRKGALGLRIMRNRASMAKGELDVDSTEDGTTVRVKLRE